MPAREQALPYGLLGGEGGELLTNVLGCQQHARAAAIKPIFIYRNNWHGQLRRPKITRVGRIGSGAGRNDHLRVAPQHLFTTDLWLGHLAVIENIDAATQGEYLVLQRLFA